jgi:hypothetical protein
LGVEVGYSGAAELIGCFERANQILISIYLTVLSKDGVVIVVG